MIRFTPLTPDERREYAEYEEALDECNRLYLYGAEQQRRMFAAMPERMRLMVELEDARMDANATYDLSVRQYGKAAARCKKLMNESLGPKAGEYMPWRSRWIGNRNNIAWALQEWRAKKGYVAEIEKRLAALQARLPQAAE